MLKQDDSYLKMWLILPNSVKEQANKNVIFGLFTYLIQWSCHFFRLPCNHPQLNLKSKLVDPFLILFKDFTGCNNAPFGFLKSVVIPRNTSNTSMATNPDLRDRKGQRTNIWMLIGRLTCAIRSSRCNASLVYPQVESWPTRPWRWWRGRAVVCQT